MLLRAGMAGALLALTTACSGDMDAATDGFENEVEDQGSEVVDAFESADAWELESDGLESDGLIEKATFNDDRTFEGTLVNCDDNQKLLIRAADIRAREILAIAMAANASTRVNRNSAQNPKASTFKTYLVPNGNTNPDPNRASPDEWDTASFRVGQKLANVSQVIASAVHTCHGADEPVAFLDGAMRTCGEVAGLAASTEFVGGADNAIRWCDFGINKNTDERAITLLHELTHQDRTADATGGRVRDNSDSGVLYNAHNYSQWFSVNTK